MRKRQSFQHYLGSNNRVAQRRLTDEEVLKCYKILRYGKSQKAKIIARKLLTLNFLGLGFAHATRFVSSRKSQSDEIVGEMIWGLIHGLELIEQGAIDHHNGTPNIAGYLVSSMTGRMMKYIQYCPPQLLPNPKSRKVADRTELRELIEKSILSDQEMKVISYREEGYKDRQIGEFMNLTTQRIHQIRTDVKKRLMELMK